jgi:hypothetical protein
MEKQEDRLIAAEEVLADMAQANPRSGFVQRAVAAIHSWLRANIPGFAKMRLTDREIIENYLIPARQFVMEGSRNDSAADMAVAFARKDSTQSAHERRIDELFNGTHGALRGTKVLDRSDVLGLLGYKNLAIYLLESKVLNGRINHHLKAEHWKKIPEWLDSPALVFDSDTVHGRLVFFAPEMLNGDPIVMIVEPDSAKSTANVSMLVNAYDKEDSERMPLRRWINNGDLRYYDKAKSPAILRRSGLQLPGLAKARSSKGKIYRDADLVKYRNDNPVFSRSATSARKPRQQPPRGLTNRRCATAWPASLIP